jgi:hypothetical protein
MTDGSHPSGNGFGCDGPSIEGRPGFIGWGLSIDESPSPITAHATFPGGRSREQPLLDTGQVIPGLTVLAPADGVDLPPGTYVFTFGSGADARRTTVCLGPRSDG